MSNQPLLQDRVTPTVKSFENYSFHSMTKYPPEGRTSKQRKALYTPGQRVYLAQLFSTVETASHKANLDIILNYKLLLFAN